MEGNADFAARYWPQLTKWADYLKEKGLDPENQLSTDDFAGHLAHNANLSIKAILALGAYAQLAEHDRPQRGGRTLPPKTAQEFAAKWAELARRRRPLPLAFDKPGTWSQKYNLVWDKLLGLNLFPPEIARKEIAYYLTKQNAYGLPLDNRARLHQARLGHLDRDAGREPRRFRQDRRPGLAVRQRIRRPASR